MPHLRIRVVGSDFEADEGEDGSGKHYPDIESATKAAVNAAVAIAADDCVRGQGGCVLEARIEDDGELIARYAIALSVELLPLPN